MHGHKPEAHDSQNVTNALSGKAAKRKAEVLRNLHGLRGKTEPMAKWLRE